MFRSKAQVAALSIVLFEDRLHLREIARRAKISAPQAKNELDTLEKIGVLSKERIGNMSVYSLNKKCPFLDELRGLFAKTQGIVPLLQKEVQKIQGVRFCIVYGSYAGGTFGPNSDIDILCIGDAPIEKLDGLFLRLQQKIGREINYIVWNEDDFGQKLAKRGAFVKSILSGKKIFAVGGEDEFGAIVKKKRNLQS